MSNDAPRIYSLQVNDGDFQTDVFRTAKHGSVVWVLSSPSDIERIAKQFDIIAYPIFDKAGDILARKHICNYVLPDHEHALFYELACTYPERLTSHERK